jgi:hypothetical protein
VRRNKGITAATGEKTISQQQLNASTLRSSVIQFIEERFLIRVAVRDKV